MYKKRLKNRPFKTSGPLQKMIDNAVEERMSALRKEGEEPVWSEYAEVAREKLEDGRTKITERRTGEIAGGDDYDGSGGYMPDDEWQAFLDSPKGKEYLERTSPKQVEEERVRFLEEVKSVGRKPVDPIEREVEQPQMREATTVEAGENSFASRLGLDLDKYANQRGSANFAQRLADDVDVANPFTQYLQGYIRGGENSGPSAIGDRFDEKTNRKLNKAYREFKEGPGKRKSTDFNQWLLEEQSAKEIMMKDKGFKQLLDENPDVRTNNLFTTMFSDSYSRENYDQGFDPKSRNDVEQKKFDRVYSGQTQRQTGPSDRPATQMLKNRTLSFRNNNNNKPTGFKMKRYVK